jgi:hypothetical protein
MARRSSTSTRATRTAPWRNAIDEADTEYLDVLIDLPGDELMPADDTLITDGTSAPGRPSPDEWGGPGGQGLPGGTEAERGGGQDTHPGR